MSYVRCINNRGFIGKDNELLEEEIVGLIPGKIYKALPTEPEAQAHSMLRVIDESAEDYLCPAAYFEPVEFMNGHATFKPTTVHLPDWMYGVLYAEAVAADQSVSALLRKLIAERYDLPEQIVLR